MLIVITGPASSGKDTIMQALLKKYPSMKRVISTTTREKRPGEIEGKDYYFVSKNQFDQMIKDGKMLEYVDFANNFYGTTKEELNPLTRGENLIWRVETSRAALQTNALVLYIDVPNWQVLHKRMKKRGISDEKIKERLKRDKADFDKYGSNFKIIILNEEGKLEEAINKIIKIIKDVPTPEVK
ncbi:hypothetical protein A3B42_02660 [Candidatus Daviesbacteria bacterium RIFCSPLOWO2_01_FULL_38_10]|uniref:Guanylate kinase n=1 Tax=Candidatus Daviesbacteria bacterium GW2011_GWF2_38_6 TaxID=1618432 RepID=A0A0G0NGG0_9BACT|nr:MAG: Guanylate kinase [Candidatus Daviesbacteria bacterium GW2011_GWF2_38_6]OGE27625.1 MAG: hypothetical protein A3D02_04315 [Candidatus Daviesbacteria bacterium RIFCSPHIGHO2_02_FULL_39_41]OGE37264.1 MAG: hypothetical protein A3B42_02660 [Candidatus Daviesbacteria bacterium RIFCSPLOWO2_01_FULL_38_10]OGE45948.1 MAG: hypothetical protein A3E67_00260 [Candidatus Daviesbacteria bacterium RIFCSPHIGHO2_12_FULL_38_25]OGE68241.1 MAG: hypothetical protein A3H81_04250 [Candidatus Daviesbacteria bacter